MWSEHCSYKSSRVHLARLPTEGPRVVQGPGENAGAVDIGDGFCAVFKMESHNHPSFIEPYQGAATGVGGILRDVFTMGARPVASLDSLRFGRPDHPRTPRAPARRGRGHRRLWQLHRRPDRRRRAAVRRELRRQHPRQRVHRRRRAHDGSLLRPRRAASATPSSTSARGPAATASTARRWRPPSSRRRERQEAPDRAGRRPVHREAPPRGCLEIFASGCLEGVQDMGAAGLTSSSVEMAGRAGTGLELDLDAIPRRTRQPLAVRDAPVRVAGAHAHGRQGGTRRARSSRSARSGTSTPPSSGASPTRGASSCKATPGYDPLDDEAPMRAIPSSSSIIPIAALTDAAPKYDATDAKSRAGEASRPRR